MEIEEAEEAEVVIVGGGAAGLGCAYTLRQAGRKRVVVLEARGRVGGRTWSIEVARNGGGGTAVDVGGQWIHASNSKNPMPEIARAHGVRTGQVAAEQRSPALQGRGKSKYDMIYDPFSRNVEVSDKEEEAAEIKFQGAMKRVEKMGEKARKAGTNLGTTVLEALAELLPEDYGEERSYERASRLVRIYGEEVQHWEGLDFDVLSLTQWDQGGQEDGKDTVLPDGYGALMCRVAEDLEPGTVRVGHQVVAIEHLSSMGGVRIRCANKRSFVSKHAVVSVPLGVLQSGAIYFKPALPEAKLQSISRLGRAIMNKVILVFEKPFWPAKLTGFSFLEPPEPHEGPTHWPIFVNLEHDSGDAILVGFNTGGKALAAELESDETIVSGIMSNMRRVFAAGLDSEQAKRKIPDPTSVVISRWASDELSRGSWGGFVAGSSPKDMREIARTVGNYLFFAGDGTCLEEQGTVHGAWMSGAREARKILQLGSKSKD